MSKSFALTVGKHRTKVRVKVKVIRRLIAAKRIKLPILVKDIGYTGSGYACGAYCESACKAVVVELNSGSALIIGYHVWIPVERSASINIAFYGSIRVLGCIEIYGFGETFDGGAPAAQISDFIVKEQLPVILDLYVYKVVSAIALISSK